VKNFLIFLSLLLISAITTYATLPPVRISTTTVPNLIGANLTIDVLNSSGDSQGISINKGPVATDGGGVLSFVLNETTWKNIDYNSNYLVRVTYGNVVLSIERLEVVFAKQSLFGAFIDASESNRGGSAIIRDINDQFISTAGQITFTLSRTPAINGKVQMFINGLRTNNNAYSISGTTVTYDPTKNNNYTLLATDRIQFDYHAGLAIGDNYGGGIVAYIFESGDPGYVAGVQHGIIVGTSNLGAGWGCNAALLPGANGTAIGTGIQNTIDISSQCYDILSAGYVCSHYTLTENGVVYNDWYLPSIDELKKIYEMKALGFGNFSESSYWSSTQASKYKAQIVSFINGSVGLSNDKNTALYYRPVRNF
jgi:hypothetical protein